MRVVHHTELPARTQGTRAGANESVCDTLMDDGARVKRRVQEDEVSPSVLDPFTPVRTDHSDAVFDTGLSNG